MADAGGRGGGSGGGQRGSGRGRRRNRNRRRNRGNGNGGGGGGGGGDNGSNNGSGGGGGNGNNRNGGGRGGSRGGRRRNNNRNRGRGGASVPTELTDNPVATPPLVDIGINLGNKQFGRDREAVIERALERNVKLMLLTGTSTAGSKKMAAMAADHPGVLYSTAGIHPHSAKEFVPGDDDGSTVAMLRALCAEDHVVSVGECGLDFNRMFSPREVQEECFRAHLELAVDLGYPLFCHEREASEAFLAIVDDVFTDATAAPPLCVHCFTGTGEEIDEYVARGFYIGITGFICDARRGAHIANLLPRVPLDRLMIETDAPFMVPKGIDGIPARTRNEPAFLPHVCAAVAEALDLSVDEVATATTANACRFFGIPVPEAAE